jgi:SAM-dependent methyltransferase
MSDSTSWSRKIAADAIARGDALGWFDEVYRRSNGDASLISWADCAPNPNLVEWLDAFTGNSKASRCAVVGCGLGDDAEEISRRGFRVTAFDISQTAIAWCRRRFPGTRVEYDVGDASAPPPPAWRRSFDLVVEAYTLQVLPAALRFAAMHGIGDLLAEGGTLLVVCRGRDDEEPEGDMPWKLSPAQCRNFEQAGVTCVRFEDYLDRENPPKRRFRIEYRR